ncbi:MAG: zinc transporter ZupT [Bacteroidales bacterium]|nr:zinc transporter ZupT [Bacteroidales bacterium]
MHDNLLIAFIITFLAGISTGIGGSIVFFSQKINEKLLTASLGFSAGVMLYVSFMELMPQSLQHIMYSYDEKISYIYMVIAFFTGIMFIALIDQLVPEADNPHEFSQFNPDIRSSSLKRTGIFTALVIGIHNFPEGLATFVSAFNDISVGISIAIAIAIHNIPEGISVAVPMFFATQNKKKAFLYSLTSGLAEPIGALIGFLILMPFINDVVLGLVFAFVAGIMVFISLDELLPSAEKFGLHHLSIFGVISGMALMALSLILMK